MFKIAILIGATGLTGAILLEKLLSDTTIKTVKLFSRNSAENKHQKIEEYLIDMYHLNDQIVNFTGDVVFCCIGTTKAKTPDKETYRKIDYGIPVAAANLSKQNGIHTFIVISSLGADSKSNVFYSRIKGEMERGVLSANIENTYILQPSLISGVRREKRLGEQLANIFMRILDPKIPRKYKAIYPETIALAMLVLSKKGYDEHIITSERIKEIAAKC